MDNKVPDPEDYEPDGLIDRLAKVLDMDRKILADAYARQERPAYDGPGERARGAFAVRESTQTANKDVLSSKEERDIARELERIMSSLESNSALAFDGEPLTEEDKELLRISLENSLRLARQIAKKKFTPHKHRN
ncbi:hypothetical protein [Alicyclobacillus macrosporangiidus]|uniref:hypothetical protein n=1 Tax=Alicyclobacillus macrosporangiidus TaxID=392015 RepID=UPI0009420AC2